MANWVNKKTVNIDNINSKILQCVESKQFTNNGKNVKQLQKSLKSMLCLDENKDVLMVCNGAMGINALIGGLNIHFNKKLKWVVQAFTFPCSLQCHLTDSIILDVDHNMGPNLTKLEELKFEYDGILITNCFGCSVNIDLYEKFCNYNNKLLLFDNAASPLTYYNNKNHLNYGIGCMVSLHHTKPIGFGEGGFIVFDNKYLNSMQKSICFGFTDTNKQQYEIYAGNYKMSEISCIYIAEYLQNLNIIREHHRKLMCCFISNIKTYNLEEHITLYKNYSDFDQSLMSAIPVVFKTQTDIDYFIKNNIEVKKYYYPLDTTATNSTNIFNNIICFPLNLDITCDIIFYYLKVICNYIKTI